MVTALLPEFVTVSVLVLEIGAVPKPRLEEFAVRDPELAIPVPESLTVRDVQSQLPLRGY
jgi:hypothetical protein